MIPYERASVDVAQELVLAKVSGRQCATNQIAQTPICGRHRFLLLRKEVSGRVGLTNRGMG
jgi:hypothetical protein